MTGHELRRRMNAVETPDEAGALQPVVQEWLKSHDVDDLWLAIAREAERLAMLASSDSASPDG